MSAMTTPAARPRKRAWYAKREREQRGSIVSDARAISTVAVFVPILAAPQLADAGEGRAVLALLQTVWFVHCFAPNVLVLWAQRDVAPDPAPHDPDPEALA